jgi:hypothetical protein
MFAVLFFIKNVAVTVTIPLPMSNAFFAAAGLRETAGEACIPGSNPAERN